MKCRSVNGSKWSPMRASARSASSCQRSVDWIADAN
jgi:hypothetical protein